MTDIPTGKLSRSSVVVEAAVKAGAKKLTQKAKKFAGLASARSSENVEIVDEEVAKILFGALTKLRGTGLKVAQMLCMNQVYIPESIRKELSKACYQVPGINRALVRKVIKDQFGDYPEKIFSSFSTAPFAAASLGQVHLASDKEGNQLAVKIQYPGIDETIRSDMATLKHLIKLLPKEYDFRELLPHIEASLLEEVDYLHELEQTQAFSTDGIEGVETAKPVEHLCTSKVFTTHYVEGIHLDKWLESEPSKADRDVVCQKLADLFIHSLKNGQRFHADPNIGNFLISEDLTVHVIDFGSTYPIEREVADNFLRLLKAYRDKDIAMVKTLGAHFYVQNACPTELDAFNALFPDFVNWKSKIFSEQGFDFAEHDHYMEQGFEIAYKAHHNEKMPFNPRADVLFYERVLYGYLQICQVAQAKVRFSL